MKEKGRRLDREQCVSPRLGFPNANHNDTKVKGFALMHTYTCSVLPRFNFHAAATTNRADE